MLEQLRRHGDADTAVLIEVNVAGEAGKGGVAPDELAAFIERCPVTVVGLMTMPPLARRPRGQPAAFRRPAGAWRRPTGCVELSMGTSQDYPAAVAEGATIVRLGTTLYAGAS